MLITESQWTGPRPLRQCRYCAKKLTSPFIFVERGEGQSHIFYHPACAMQLTIQLLTDIRPLLGEEPTTMADIFRTAAQGQSSTERLVPGE